ncbi:MFS transporter [Halomonas binhaiensis]|uniref:MFS transporter n=1 Tax=Halomonas binhaiensis TaxID=2562282 RepID=A0A5C1NIS2_9GAMM|nr:MFS transporter [Halomonas binhaiensis]QEM83612.1 MFS transporter [Halomonas binhaiensis]
MRTIPYEKNKFLDIRKTRILSTEALSVLSSQMISFSISIVAVSFTNMSDAEVGLIGTFAGLGTFIFLLFFMPIADIGRKDILMGGISLFRAIVSGTIAYYAIQGNIDSITILVSVFFLSGASSVYESTFSAYLPCIVKRNELPRMNSWIAGLRSAMDIGAGSISGVVLATGGPISMFLMITSLYIISSLGPLSFRKEFMEKKSSKSIQRGNNWLRSAFMGIKILLKDPRQRILNISIVHFNIFTAAIQSIYIVYTVRYVGMSELELGVAGSIGGAIGLSGVYLSERLFKRFSMKALMGGTLIAPGFSCLAILALPVVSSKLTTIILGISLGLWIASVLINVAAFETQKQILVPEEHIGKYSAASRLVTWGVDPLGSALGVIGVLTLPLPLVLLIATLGIFSSSIWIFTSQSLSDLPLKSLCSFT